MKRTPTFYATAYLHRAEGVKGEKLQAFTAQFWRSVWRAKHFGWRHKIIAEVKRLWQKERGVIQVKVLSAKAITPPAAAALRSDLTDRLGGEVALELEVKPHLMSGLVLTIGDRRYDGSLKARLDALSTALEGSDSLT